MLGYLNLQPHARWCHTYLFPVPAGAPVLGEDSVVLCRTNQQETVRCERGAVILVHNVTAGLSAQRAQSCDETGWSCVTSLTNHSAFRYGGRGQGWKRLSGRWCRVGRKVQGGRGCDVTMCVTSKMGLG